MEIQEISNIIFDIKENLTTQQFKTIMDNLGTLHNTKQVNDDELTKEFFRQFFYHSPKNNMCFHYQYINEDNSIYTIFLHSVKKWNVGDEFLHEKGIKANEPFEIKVKITKIMPKYCILDHKKKISNLTLSKIVNFPYIFIM